jgi:hypothetical protein
MKLLIFILLLVLANYLSLAQHNTFNKEAELQRFIERGGKVEETSPNIYKLTYRDDTQRVFNLNPAANQNSYIEGFDSTIINVWEIDTTLYAYKFKFWQRVDLVYSSKRKAPIEDINNNGLLELYGVTRYNWPFGGQVDILEQDSQGIFHTVYSYDSTSIAPLGIGDVNSDGIKEVHLRSTDTLNGKFYKADSLGAFPTTFDFIFYYYPNQIQDENFGDFDKNGITDCAFVDGSNPSRIIISEFRDSINNFTTLFNMPTEGDVPSGFAIGDYDQDNKTELVLGTTLQKAYVIEAKDTNLYSLMWQGLAPTYNAYMVTSTKDIDGNGKDEFWIGGQDLVEGISKFWCYEADGDNNYIPVAGIELRYLVSLFTNYMQAADIDNDGVEELVINVGNHLLILKFTGKPNQHSYNVFYSKIGEKTQPGSLFYPSTIYDLDGNGKKDILLSLDIDGTPNISYILIQDKITSVTDNGLQITDNFDLSQNYPNPFNPSTQIKVTVKEQSNIQVAVYNILGKEIKLLLNEDLPSGEYTIQWDGKDNEGNILSGGGYFIRMIAGSYHKIIKSILLK